MVKPLDFVHLTRDSIRIPSSTGQWETYPIRRIEENSFCPIQARELRRMPFATNRRNRKRPGPKLKPVAELRRKRLDVPVSLAERQRCEAAAAKAGKALTVWAREVLLAAAER